MPTVNDAASEDLNAIIQRLRPKQRAFLAAYAEMCSITTSAEAAGVKRVTHYGWLRESEDYRQAFALVEPIAVQHLEDIAVGRATDGWLEPVFYQGAECGTVRKFSDSLLQFLLRGRDKKYRDKQQLSTVGEDGEDAPLKLEVEYVSKKAGD